MDATSLSGGTGGLDGRRQPPQQPVGMADATIPPGAAIEARAALGDRRHTRLEQLVGGDPEEVRNAIKVLQLDFPLAEQELADPNLTLMTPQG